MLRLVQVHHYLPSRGSIRIGISPGCHPGMIYNLI